MVVKDFFWLNDEEYAKRISFYTPERLQRQERVKGQQQMSAILATGSGIALSCVTWGCTLGVSAYAIRRQDVARRKHTLIQRELSGRNIELYVPRQRDFCIPLSAFTCGICVSAGVGIGLHHVVEGALPNDLTGGASAVNMMVVNPSGALSIDPTGGASAVSIMAVNPSGAFPIDPTGGASAVNMMVVNPSGALSIDPTGGASAVSIMAVNPSGAAAGMTAGAAEGLKAVIHPLSAHVSNTLVSEGALYSSAQVQDPLISEGVSYSIATQGSLLSEGTSLSSAYVVDPFAVGDYYGLLGVQTVAISLEKSAANLVSSTTTDKALNKMLNPTQKKKDKTSLNTPE